MVSSAPVASPTLIIWTTMGGNTLVSLSGAAIVSPRSMLLRVDMIASSTMMLPAVLAVISSPSRIGTPDEISVESVRQNRATAFFLRMSPIMGALSANASTMCLPPLVAYHCLKAQTPAADTAARGMKYPTRFLLSQITNRVGAGSSAPRLANMSANVGMTFQRMTPTMIAAMEMTAMG